MEAARCGLGIYGAGKCGAHATRRGIGGGADSGDSGNRVRLSLEVGDGADTWARDDSE